MNLGIFTFLFLLLFVMAISLYVFSAFLPEKVALWSLVILTGLSLGLQCSQLYIVTKFLEKDPIELPSIPDIEEFPHTPIG